MIRFVSSFKPLKKLHIIPLANKLYYIVKLWKYVIQVKAGISDGVQD